MRVSLAARSVSLHRRRSREGVTGPTQERTDRDSFDSAPVRRAHSDKGIVAVRRSRPTSHTQYPRTRPAARWARSTCLAPHGGEMHLRAIRGCLGTNERGSNQTRIKSLKREGKHNR